MPALPTRQAPAFPWLAAEPLDGLVPHRDPTGADVLFVPNDGTLAAARTSQIVDDVTRLLGRAPAMPAAVIRRELSRIATYAILLFSAIGISAGLAAQVLL